MNKTFLSIKNKTKIILMVIFLISSFLLSFYLVQNKNISEQKSDATENFTPWTFVIINDTHAKDQHFFDSYFQMIANENPNLILHLGDAGWNQHLNKISDYRYQPLKGIIDLQYRQLGMDKSIPFTEIHFVPGNHDVQKISERPYTLNGVDTYENIFTLLDGTRNDICHGTHTYWGESNDNFNIHFGENYKSINHETALKKTGYKAFNQDIINSQYCSEKEMSSVYSIERGGIRFVIFGWDITNNIEVPHKFNELKSEVCGYTGNLPTVLLNHDGHRDVNIVQALNCSDKFVAMFSGHTHFDKKEVVDGVPLFTETGLPYDGLESEEEIRKAIIPTNGEALDIRSTMIVGYVKKNEVVFERWIDINKEKLEPTSKELFFTIKGNFTSYKNPYFTINKISIKKGGNLINLPNYSLEQLINDKDLIVSSLDSGQWIFLSNKSNLEIPKGTGVYIKSKTDKEISLIGNFSNFDTSTAKKGWNLIGITEYKTAKDFINSSENSDIATICDLKNNKFSCFLKRNNGFTGNDFKLDSQKAYLILKK